jgi:hypothetical protein
LSRHHSATFSIRTPGAGVASNSFMTAARFSHHLIDGVMIKRQMS